MPTLELSWWALVSLLIGITFVFALFWDTGKIWFPPGIRLVSLLAVLTLCWMILVNVAHATPFDQVLRLVLGRVLAPLLVALAMWYVASATRLRLFTYIFIFSVAISATIAIGQYVLGEPFVRLYLYAGGVVSKLSAGSGTSRPAGLATDVVALSYHLSSAVPLTFALLMTSRSRTTRWWLALGSIIMVVSLVMNQTRSAVLGVILGSVAVAWHGSRRRLRTTMLLIMVLAIGYWVVGTYFFPRVVDLSDGSTFGRALLAAASLLVAVENPFGVGLEGYFQAISQVYPRLSHLPGSERILAITSHNQFLNMLVYYGIPGLALLAVFYVSFLRALREIPVQSLPLDFERGLRVGLLGGLVAYIVNSLFHNPGPFIGEPSAWIFVGLVGATSKVAHQRLRNSRSGRRETSLAS